MIELTKANFDSEVTNAHKPVLVDFWSEGCGPCKMMEMVLEEVAAEYPDIAFAKMDAAKYPDVAFSFDVVSVPTVALFNEGRMKESIVGAEPKARIEKLLESVA